MAFQEPSKAPMTIGAVWTIVSLATIVVAARLYTRVWIKRSAGLDDVAIFISWAICISYTPVQTMQMLNGFGSHIKTLTPQQKENVARWQVVVQFTSWSSLFFLRLSVPWFLLRLISGVSIPRSSWIRYALYSLLGLNVGATIFIMIVYAVQCIPMRAAWDPKAHGKCLDAEFLSEALRAFAIIGVVIDLFCALTPIPIIRGLELSKNTKIRICIVLGLGFVPAGCSLGKAINSNTPTHDFTWDWVPTKIFSVYEEATGMIVASLPALSSLFSHMREPSRRPHRLDSSGEARSLNTSTANAYRKQHGSDDLFPPKDIEANAQAHGRNRPGTSNQLMAHDEIHKTTDMHIELSQMNRTCQSSSPNTYGYSHAHLDI